MNTVNLNEDVSQKLYSHEDMQVLRRLTRYIADEEEKQESHDD